MLALTAFEFIVRTIPEVLIYIFAGYVFSNTKINIKRYLIASLILAVSTFIVRMFPINYGVHTILIISIQIAILICISEIDTILAIRSSIITTISLFIIELLNLWAINLIFKEQLETIMSNPISKTIYGLPSLGCFAIIVVCYYLRKRDKTKYVKN